MRADQLLALPVRLHGIQLGRAVDLLLDREELRVLGFDVLCGDGGHRFLRLPTAVIRDEQIGILSPLLLLEEDELAVYQARTFALESLRGCAVEAAGRRVGTLEDVVVGPNGALVDVIVGVDGEERRVPFDETVRLQRGGRSAA